MYAAGRPHALKEACTWIMTEIAAGKLPVATDTEVIQEILYRYGHLGHLDAAVTMATSVLDLVPDVYPVAEKDVRLAIELFDRYAREGIPARDVIHAAVMLGRGLRQIISTDSHFDQIEGIERLDPRELYEARRGPT